MASNPDSPPMLAICCGTTVTTWKYTFPKCTTEFGANSTDGIVDGVDSFTPHGNSILADVAWHQNGRVLATCSTSCLPEEENVVLTNSTLRTRIDGFSNSSGKAKASGWRPPATSVSFGGKSRYLCISDAGGYVSVWDMKKNSRVRHLHAFSDDGSGDKEVKLCSKACMDPTDKYIAALSSSPADGSLRLFNLRDASLVRSYIPPDGSHGGADTFRFSSFETNHAAVGTRDGSVFVWDITSTSVQPLSSMLKRHDGAVTDVCFSPANRVLLGTSSLDGTFSFHDIHSEKTIQVIHPAEAAAVGRGSGITCLSLQSDGVTCAVGTTQGIVCLYDLRKTGSGPISTLQVGASSSSSGGPHPVVAAQFAAETSSEKRTKSTHRSAKKSRQDGKEKDHGPPARSLSPAMRQDSKHPGRTLPSSSTLTSVKTEESAPKISPSTSTSHNLTSIKTPLNAKQASVLSQIAGSNPPLHDSLPTESTVGEVKTLNNAQKEMMIDSSVPRSFSSNNEFSSYSSKRVLAADGNQKGDTLNYNFAQKQDAESPSPSKVHTDPDKQRYSQSKSSYAKGYAPYEGNENQYESSQQQHDLVGTAKTVKTPSVQSSSDLYGHYVGKTPLHTNQMGLPGAAVSGIASANLTNVLPSHDNDTGRTAEDDVNMKVNKLVLRNMVENAVDNLRDDMEVSMRNLHVDILRQFQRQSDEISQLFQKQKDAIESLLEENRELREENERLRRFY